MNRRSAIRQAVIISAGAALLPSCVQGDQPAIDLKNLAGSQKDMLSALCEAILPKTNSFIGASDLKSDQFVLTMVNDCHSPEEQQKFATGMKQFEDGCKKKFDHSFAQCNPAEKKEWLQALEKETGVAPELQSFYDLARRYTVQSFTSSEDFMTKIRNYKMVPGPNFKGCVPVA